MKNINKKEYFHKFFINISMQELFIYIGIHYTSYV